MLRTSIYTTLLTLLLVIFSTSAMAANPLRSITVNNQCPFDVSLQSIGSNASAVACSPSDTNAQANCPGGFVCYAKNKNTNYCVAGSAVSGAKLPLSSIKDITLSASSCKSNSQVSDVNSSNWGQCQCTSDNGCDNNQACQSATSTLKQCYWHAKLSNNGNLSKKSGSSNTLTIPLTPNSQTSDAMVVSGKLYAKLGCDVNGKCTSDNSLGAPATLVEFTFQNNNDWYDVSYINGINLPASLQPVLAKNLDYKADDPYRCMAAGGDTATMGAIFAYQKANKLPSNQDLKPFACTNNYSTAFDGTDKTGFNFVSDVLPQTACSKTSPCSDNLTCGLTLDAVKNNSTATMCGSRLGYWTYAQMCSINKTYDNSDLGVKCSSTKNYAYALCENQSGLKDKGPARSCFNATTTNKGDTCCGYQQWALNNKAATKQPVGKGDSAVTGAVTTDWVNNILPNLKAIKANCPLAYSFQFDDPYSTFTCATTGSGLNSTNYELTLCPNGNSANINPPQPAACKPVVPSAYSSDQFTIGAPSGISLVVNPCDAKGNCAAPSLAGSSGIYTAPVKGTGQFEIIASNGSETQACKFTIPRTACLTPIAPSGDCKIWAVSTDGAWSGRSISIPDF